jgi:NADH-quinone oxidoreductase subunit G
MTRTWTTCTICGSACRLEVDSYRSKVKRVVGRIGINTGHNRGYICVRGRWGWDILYSDKRLTTPLLAEGDGVKKITLSEAVAILKEKTERAKVNLYIESSLTTEELHLLGAVFGTENVTSDALSYSMALDGIAEITGERKTDPFSAIDEADTVFLIADFMEEINPVLMTLVKFAVVRGGKKLLRLGTYPSKLDRITSVLIKTSEEKVLDSLKHIIMSTFDSSYTSGSDAIDRASEIVRSGKVAFVLGGAFLFSPDVKELAKAVAYLAGRLRAKSHIVLVPPKANTLKVAELFPLKAPQELSGDVNVLVNTELYRDFPGVELKGSYTVLFTPYYTQDLAFADLIIPIETGLEKSGTVAGVNGNHRLSTALSPPFSLKGILQSLTFKGAPSTVKEKPSVNTELGDTSIRREKGKLLLTVVPNRTGWNSVSQYSENVSKVATSTVLYLNPQDAPEGSVVVLKTESAELPLPFEVSRTVPTGSALLKVERFTRGISRLLKGCFPFLSGIQCEIEIGEA